ncbi:response regulator [Methanoregula sp.]|uniref:response regulator n=1 Tax=Methanoregula sp. TaxID=2052170 RepID=UPI003C14E1EC
MTDTVLVVDDSTFIVEGLVALLKKTYRAIPSFGGEECLQILLTEKPSVIILDIMMEPMDGWETLSRIKDNPRTRNIPVLMFSAKKISFEEAEAHRIRIDDFLTKPVNPKELLSAVARILERQDRKKRTLSCWTARGVPPEKIDEYLTLSSNSEIDTSLLAVMKKQLAHPSITELRREDLASSVLVLEERIRSTGSLIESFFHDTGISLPCDSDPPELPAAMIGTPPCETPSLPREADTGNLPAGISASGIPENDPGRNEAEDHVGISMAPAADSVELMTPPQPEKNMAFGNLPIPGSEPETPVDDLLSRDENNPPQDPRGEFPDDSNLPQGSDPRNPDGDIPRSPDPFPGVSADTDTVVDPYGAAGDNPAEEHTPAKVPFDPEELFESEPRPDHVTAGHACQAPHGFPPDSDVPLLQGTCPLEKDIPPVNIPDTSTRGRETKIPGGHEVKPGAGSSGRGILAIIFRLLFGGRG